MIAAVNQDGWAFEFTSLGIQRDKEIVMAAVNQDGDALEFAPEYLWRNKDTVMAAVKQDGMHSSSHHGIFRRQGDSDGCSKEKK